MHLHTQTHAHTLNRKLKLTLKTVFAKAAYKVSNIRILLVHNQEYLNELSLFKLMDLLTQVQFLPSSLSYKDLVVEIM